MYAVIRTGGKQYKVSEGDCLVIEKLDAEVGAEVSFDVLMLADENGVKIGKPLLAGAQVTGEVVEHGKGKKIIVFKYKPKKNYRKKQGHRQPYTKVKITSIK
ncbi:MAG TPA: 50S ribosomal protein L21 [Clostridiales bacterium]|jgi:large subunit ribosomal protein L21|nr:50S ribosomal protein L21 [Clostridiales bacterium]